MLLLSRQNLLTFKPDLLLFLFWTHDALDYNTRRNDGNWKWHTNRITLIILSYRVQTKRNLYTEHVLNRCHHSDCPDLPYTYYRFGVVWSVSFKVHDLVHAEILALTSCKLYLLCHYATPLQWSWWKLFLFIHINRSCGFANNLQFQNNKSVDFVSYIINLKSDLKPAKVIVSVSHCDRLVSIRTPEHNNMQGKSGDNVSNCPIGKTQSFKRNTPRIIHRVRTLVSVGMICSLRRDIF